MLAEYFWDILEKEYPHVLGPTNPYNQEIEKLQNTTVLNCDGL